MARHARARHSLREPTASYLLREIVLVDSNVLIDILEADSTWFDWSAAQLAPLVAQRRAAINPIIYAEIATPFARLEDLDMGIAPLHLWREPLPWEAAFLASRAFQLYRRRGGSRRSPLPDFYIGAHASIASYALLTRDPRRYVEYFPKLRVIAPN